MAALSADADSSAPYARIVVPDSPGRPDVPYVLRFQLRWTGGPESFVALSPELKSIDWGRAAVTATRTRVEEQETVVEHEVSVVPGRPGEFETPEVRLRYAPATAFADELAKQQSGDGPAVVYPALTCEPVRLTVKQPAMYWPWVAGAGGLALCGLAGLLLWRTRRTTSIQPGLTPVELASQAIHRARQHRLDGDFYGVYRSLADAAERLGSNGEARTLASKFHRRVQEVGYGGMRPTDDELDGDLRDVERALARRKEEQAG